MDTWTLNEKLKNASADIKQLEKRLIHIEEYLGNLNSKLELINKASNEAVSNKKDKSSGVRTKRSTAKKS